MMIITEKQTGKDRGFTLVECCLVIIILGLVLGPLFQYLTAQRVQQKQFNEEGQQDEVLAALALYLKENSRYPCPADPTLVPGDANFGAENCAIVPVAGINLKQVLIGAVPVKDLNLPFRLAANGNSWKYTYAVTQTLTVPTTFDGIGGINIVDNAGASILALNHGAPFVLVNPGNDGKGARTLMSAQIAANCGAAADSQNCSGTAKFRDMPKNLTGNATAAGYYDDTISYTLARKESTLWVMNQSGTAAGDLDISNRNQGNVGIGTPTPAAGNKLDVVGGNVGVRADAGGNGGSLNVDKDITATGNVSANNNITAGQQVTSPVFYYP